MIIVNVSVPALETVYNFSLEETAKISDLMVEIVELIAQKEHVSFSGDMNEMVLCSMENAEQFDKDHCLADYRITGGTELILV